MKNFIVSITFIVIFIVEVTSQNTFQQNQENLEKYWFYRDRLKYFIVLGTGPGESLVAGIRNNYFNETIYQKHLDFGDQTMYLGEYIGLLATEARLLLDYGQDASSTLNELSLALNSYYRLDIYWEKNEMGWTNDALSCNGFFVRKDIPLDFVANHFDQLNSGCCQKAIPWEMNCYPWGTPSIVEYARDGFDRVMSQDQAIALLMGFALVKKCLPGTVYALHAKSYATKIVTWIRGPYPASYYNELTWPWKICYPDGISHCVSNADGGDAMLFAWGFMQALSYISDLNIPAIWGYTPYSPYHLVWNTYQTGNVQVNGSSFMVPMLAAIGNSFGGNTPAGIFNLTRYENWHTFYLLLYAYLHETEIDGLPNNHNQSEIINDAEIQINTAPCAGPYCFNGNGIKYISSVGGWGSAQKWHQSEEVQRNGPEYDEFLGVYNGIDFMLLYNLYHLFKKNILSEEMPVYLNYNNRSIGDAFPQCIGFGNNNLVIGGSDHHSYFFSNYTVESNALIDIQVHNNPNSFNPDNCPEGQYDPGNVIFCAGETIKLQPGFQAKTGCYFHAFIQKRNCGNIDFCDEIPTLDDVQVVEPTGTVCKNMWVFICAEINNDENCYHQNLYYDWEVTLPGGTPLQSNNIHKFGNCISFYANYQGTYHYSVQVSDINGIGNSESGSINVLCQTCCDPLKSFHDSIPDSTGNLNNHIELIIYPNPSQGIFTIQYPNSLLEFITIQVFNILGNIVYEEKIRSRQIQKLDLSKLADGMYYLKIFNKDKEFKEKIAIQH